MKPLAPLLAVVAGLFVAAAFDELRNANDTCNRILDEELGHARLDAMYADWDAPTDDFDTAADQALALFTPEEIGAANDLAEIESWIKLPLYDVPVNQRRQR